MKNDIVDSLLAIAFEAEDITKQTQKESNRIDEGAPARRSKSISADTSDIFGTKGDAGGDDSQDDETDDTDQTDDTEDDTGDDDTDPDSTDEGDDTDPEDDGTGLDDGSDTGDDSSTDDTTVSENSDIAKKEVLKENLIEFYYIIKGNIDALVNFNSDNVNKELYDHFFKIQTRLINCKEILYRMIVEEINDGSYIIMLKKYVAIKKIYDICILMLDRFYDSIKVLNSDKKGVKK